MTLHGPLGKQHPPLGEIGHRVQREPAPENNPHCSSQSQSVVMMQLPSGRQHAPLSGSHVRAPQFELLPLYTPPWPSQLHSEILVQLPSGKQQAPRIGGGGGGGGGF